jgi:ADP-ribose pyrophosphatase
VSETDGADAEEQLSEAERSLIGDGDWSVAEPRPQRARAGDPAPFEPFETTGSRRIYESPWCGLRQDFIRLPDGHEQDYHVFEVSNAVAVVPLMADGSMRMVWQYRYPSGRSQWEVPAGRIHGGEAPALAAARELREEIGCEAEQLIALPGFFPTGGISAHYAHAFLALGCREVGALELDPAERISVRDFDPEQVRRRLNGGDYADAFTSLSLFYAFNELERRASAGASGDQSCPSSPSTRSK